MREDTPIASSTVTVTGVPAESTARKLINI